VHDELSECVDTYGEYWKDFVGMKLNETEVKTVHLKIIDASVKDLSPQTLRECTGFIYCFDVSDKVSLRNLLLHQDLLNRSVFCDGLKTFNIILGTKSDLLNHGKIVDESNEEIATTKKKKLRPFDIVSSNYDDLDFQEGLVHINCTSLPPSVSDLDRSKRTNNFLLNLIRLAESSELNLVKEKLLSNSNDVKHIPVTSASEGECVQDAFEFVAMSTFRTLEMNAARVVGTYDPPISLHTEITEDNLTKMYGRYNGFCYV